MVVVALQTALACRGRSQHDDTNGRRPKELAPSSDRPPEDSSSCLFFFFQAEDGIRDYKVTGVQTCALPISKREVGNSIARIDAAKLVETAPITNVTDLLIAKVAGVDVLPGNVTGAPSRVRIRGTNSLSLNNEPVYSWTGSGSTARTARPASATSAAPRLAASTI